MDSHINRGKSKNQSVSCHFCEQNFLGMDCLCLGSCLSERHATGPCVPAAILGMHTLMSNQQYYQALGSSSIVNKEGLNSEYWPHSLPHCEGISEVRDPPESCYLRPLSAISLQKISNSTS